ncbi:flagellar hook capping protein [Phenylobacterium hankyongense]|uniref:Basal-body rod modification protein FlgD n=1 Tax=Phenylobacterium hankyongense TaxID=1813876 RepID=A0A328AZI9_9CAUL|nr:flagellar hook capping FlgD N-terminal domain-containing protein [Phenylobacterium hankyongense]RAK59601.1 flagellar hook capping protein [Phenylobacterium hankyongense]
MTVTATSGATAPATTPATSSSASASLTSNQFLSLLTTQLQNQDPLNPTDPNQFTAEMVQYGSLSQQIDTNTKLDALSTTMSSILTQVSQLASASAATPAA